MVGGATQLRGRCGREARLRHARLTRVVGVGAGSVHGEGGAGRVWFAATHNTIDDFSGATDGRLGDLRRSY